MPNKWVINRDMANFTSWIKKNLITRYMMKDGCPDKQKCFEILETYLDGEATPEEEAHFHQQIDGCWQCYQEYELDKVLKRMVSENGYEKKEVPVDLAEAIKAKIENPS